MGWLKNLGQLHFDVMHFTLLCFAKMNKYVHVYCGWDFVEFEVVMHICLVFVVTSLMSLKLNQLINRWSD